MVNENDNYLRDVGLNQAATYHGYPSTASDRGIPIPFYFIQNLLL